MTDLTEQYKHGNLPDDRLYYYRFKGEPEVQITTQYGLYCEEADNKKEMEVIDFVPSYEEYLSLTYAKEEDDGIIAEYEAENTQLKERNDSLNNRDINLCRIANGIRDENFALKELLKECRNILNEQTFYRNTCLETDETLRNRIVKKAEILQKISEVLK